MTENCENNLDPGREVNCICNVEKIPDSSADKDLKNITYPYKFSPEEESRREDSQYKPKEEDFDYSTPSYFMSPSSVSKEENSKNIKTDLTNVENANRKFALKKQMASSLKKTTAKKVTNKRGRPRKKPERSPLKKKKWTSYTVFTAEWQPRLRKKHPDISFKEVMELVASKWHSLPATESYKYTRKAQEKNEQEEKRVQALKAKLSSSSS